ncbi:MAG: K(+)-transporting ATPase subunit F [Gemmatimonadaceae bacterium]
MNTGSWIAGALAVAVLAYLVYALLRPDRF